MEALQNPKQACSLGEVSSVSLPGARDSECFSASTAEWLAACSLSDHLSWAKCKPSGRGQRPVNPSGRPVARAPRCLGACPRHEAEMSGNDLDRLTKRVRVLVSRVRDRHFDGGRTGSPPRQHPVVDELIRAWIVPQALLLLLWALLAVNVTQQESESPAASPSGIKIPSAVPSATLIGTV